MPDPRVVTTATNQPHPISSTGCYTCKTVVSPNKSTARGVLEVRDSSQVSLTNVELR
jgi:hypothetical protein